MAPTTGTAYPGQRSSTTAILGQKPPNVASHSGRAPCHRKPTPTSLHFPAGIRRLRVRPSLNPAWERRTALVGGPLVASKNSGNAAIKHRCTKAATPITAGSVPSSHKAAVIAQRQAEPAFEWFHGRPSQFRNAGYCRKPAPQTSRTLFRTNRALARSGRPITFNAAAESP